jgi:O-antigen/teichoic acid export membrane protein
MNSNEDSYKKIFKTTSIFGGVQVFNIIIALLRSKAVAIFLGPAGFGVMSLFNTTINLMTGFTNFGLGTSAVKDIASASSLGDDDKLTKTVALFRKLVWITGSFGFILTLVTAPLLSKLAFGNRNYTTAFMLLSITLLFSQLSAGQSVILRGLRKIQYLAKASVFGSILGLVISLPLYYFFDKQGIVPAMILTSLSVLYLTWYYASKLQIPSARVEVKTIKLEGMEMVKMGFLISMSGLIGMGSSYLLRIYISNIGSIEDVGLFSAGFSLISTYVGMVFTAMSTDYYPRLSTVAHDNHACRQQINQQIEIALLIIAPILTVFLVFIKLGIILLYSQDFVSIINMVQWAALGVFFQALSWSIGFVFLAKGASQTFFWNELIAYSYMLILNALGYYLFGLTGLGISFLLGYILHFLQMYLVSRSMYFFRFNKKTIEIFIFQFSIAASCFAVVYFSGKLIGYLLGVILIFISIYYSYKNLDQRIGITQLILKRIKN